MAIQWQFVPVQPTTTTAIDLRFAYTTTHTLQYNNGQVTANPAIPPSNGLYVILNNSTNRSVYVGTASNILQRFSQRFQVCVELGLGQNDVASVRIYTIQIYTNQQLTPPGNNGRTTNTYQSIDVEHLLIRTYISGFNRAVRNTGKIGQFFNHQGVTINWSLVDNGGTGIGGPFAFNLASGAGL
jgi:hypothetical protein